ncbi:DJ-1/PfpI family protein [Dyella sp. ASV21]|uniref:GlxA family transcriptional regulator n=1 Tax=Dyella sp. ASV21 TaxID=2795114 RepID=UPI0018EE11D5|nr:DJ-1/PfpI family protein [Dyella sp. ASV21]
MKGLIWLTVLAMLPVAGMAAEAPAKTAPHDVMFHDGALQDGMIKVAFAISEHANVMDIAGPWEVFQDTSLKDAKGKEISPYALYTVSESTAPLKSAGANRPGLTITPDYDFDHAPLPDIVVVPAQHGSPALQAWLQQLHVKHVTVVSVCTGAFQLARAGLLNDKHATTHHWYFGNFEREFPKVTLVKDVRYVQADPITFTAGGLNSGIDLALHLVADRFGERVAEQTANFMEYLGSGWKTNQGIAALDLPIERQDWAGQLAGGEHVVLHQVTYGASPTFTLDIPAQKVTQAPVTLSNKGNEVTLAVAIAGHPATFTGQVATSGDAISGRFSQDGRAQPLTFTQTHPAE